MDTTIDTSYSMFPSAYRQHWRDEHHSTEQIITEASEGYTLVVECDGRIVGTGNVLHEQIQSVFIHPEYQRRGYGTAVVHRLEDHVKRASVRILRVSALTPSKRFFEGLGYHVMSENRFRDEPLQHFKYYIMEKRM
jgi:N-acetylglutamate synthase-like GNAT family acetyltransferase